MKKLVFAIALIFSMTACSDAEKAAWGALGEKHRVTLYSGGQKVGEWTTTGKIENESSSDGYYFNDEKTGKLVSVTGTLVIECM